MSSKRSDSLALPAVAQPPSAVAFFESQPGAAVPHSTGWLDTLRANALIPVALIGIALLGRYVIEPGINLYYQRVVMLIGFNIILAVSLQLINGFSGQFSLG